MIRYKTDKKPSIQVVDRFLSPDDFQEVCQFAYSAPYGYGESDMGDLPPTGMACDIFDSDDPSLPDEAEELTDFIHSKIVEKFPEVEKDYQLYRAYINCFAPREVAYFHQDCDDHDDQLTFLFYSNATYKGLNEGGTTEFYLDDKIISLPPIPNTLVKFTSWIWHRATPLVSDHRFSYAFKYRRKAY